MINPLTQEEWKEAQARFLLPEPGSEAVGKWVTRLCQARIEITDLEAENKQLHNIVDAARDLYDNRLGWSDGRNPYAPPEFWDRLEKSLTALGDRGSGSV